MRRSVLACCVITVLGLIPSLVLGQPVNPSKFFEESFGASYRKVAATKAFDDDLELAQQIFDAAATLKETSTISVAVYLLDRVFSLSMADPQGYDLALEAMEHRIRIHPADAETTRKRTEQALRLAYGRSRGETRKLAGVRLADYLTMLGDLRAAASDFGGAARLYVQAQRFAKDVESPNLTAIETKAVEATKREKIEQRIEQAQQRMLKGANRSAAADELVDIYLLEFFDPAEAAKYAAHVSDNTAKRLTPLLLKDPEDVSAGAMLDLGQWCETLAAKAADRTKLDWYRRSRVHLELFTTSTGADELDRLKASVVLKRVKAEIAKLDPEHAQTVAMLDENGEVDLLSKLDLKRFKVRGLWRQTKSVAPPAVAIDNADAAGLVAHGTVGDAVLMLPIRPEDSYQLHLVFKRTAGQGQAAIHFPIGDRTIRLILGGWQDKAAGLYPMTTDVPSDDSTKPIKNETTVEPHALTTDKTHQVAIHVDRSKTVYRVTVTFDGQTLIKWSGMAGAFREDDQHELWEPAAIGLSAKDADVLFTEARLKPLRGDARILPKPATLAERGVITPRDGVVDLMELWIKKKDVVDGTWSFADGVLTAAPGRQYIGRTMFPVAPVSDYHLRLELTRGESRNFNSPIIYLPWSDKAIALQSYFDRRSNSVVNALASINGANILESPAQVKGKAMAVGQKYAIDARLKKADDELAIEIDLDGKPYIRWQGDPGLLTVPAAVALKDARTIGLACRYGNYSFENIHFQTLAGVAPMTRQTARADQPTAVATDTKPVSPIALVKLKRDRASGTWKHASDRLMTEVRGLNATAMVNLPVRPKGNYQFRCTFAPTAGRPVFKLLLPVAGRAVQLDVGLTHGKVSSLRAVGSPSALKSSTAIRVTNGRSYTFDVDVEHIDGKVNVKVKADGKPLLSWSGTPATLTTAYSNYLPANYNAKSIAIGVMNDVARSGGVISNARLQMTKGKANPLQ